MGVFFLVLLMLSTSLHADTHKPQQFLKQIRGSSQEGEQIVAHFCANCHAQQPLIPLGAPRIGEQGDWKARLKQDIRVLYQHTDEGFNAMPPRGGCFECTEEQLILALLELVPKKDKKTLLNKLSDYKKYKK